ncbi:hypothetical protein [Thalassospira lohafexi]|nr:hypothetical protein [Thalassospira lohafexi]
MTYALETDDWSDFEDIALKHIEAGDDFIEMPDGRADEFCRLYFDSLVRRKKEDNRIFAGWHFMDFGISCDGGGVLVERLSREGEEPFTDPEDLAVFVRAYPENYHQAIMYRTKPVRVVK